MIEKNHWFFRQIWLLKRNTEPFLALAGMSWLLVGFFLTAVRGEDIPSKGALFFLIIAFFSARTAGMCFNRFIDREIDAKNIRTSSRPLANKSAEPREVLLQGIFFSFLFMAAVLFLDYQLQIMAVFIQCMISIYSYTKRYTFLCHFVLGIIHFCIPITGSLWIGEDIASLPFSVWCSAFSAFFSVSSSDIFYSIQDREIDKELHFSSIPVYFGIKLAKIIAICCYLFAILFASLALFFSGSTGSLLLFFLFFLSIGGFLWRYLLKDRYIPIERQLFFMLPLLPSICAILGYIRWFGLDIMLLEFLGHQGLFLALK